MFHKHNKETRIFGSQIYLQGRSYFDKRTATKVAKGLRTRQKLLVRVIPGKMPSNPYNTGGVQIYTLWVREANHS